VEQRGEETRGAAEPDHVLREGRGENHLGAKETKKNRADHRNLGEFVVGRVEVSGGRLRWV